MNTTEDRQEVGVQPKSQMKKTTVVFRMDDYSSVSWTELEVRIIETFEKHGLACTFAIVPFTGWGDTGNPLPSAYLPLISEKVSILKRAIANGTIDVAQHGYCHQSYRGHNTEFAGFAPEIQREKIRRGRDLLRSELGIDVLTFVPPWNSYDCATLRCLSDLGFAGISGGRDGPVDADLAMQYLPSTCTLPQLRALLDGDIPEIGGGIITVLFHPYDFREHSPKRGFVSVEELDALLGRVAAHPGMQVRSVSGCFIGGGLDSGRLVANRAMPVVPPFVADSGRIAFLDTALANNNRRRALGTAIPLYFLYVAASIVAAIAAIWMLHLDRASLVACAAAAVILCAGLASYALRDRSISYRGLSALLPASSVAATFVVSAFRAIRF